ncbi:MAG: alginate lyase family protein [Geminicoccaceae bacterium]
MAGEAIAELDLSTYRPRGAGLVWLNAHDRRRDLRHRDAALRPLLSVVLPARDDVAPPPPGSSIDETADALARLRAFASDQAVAILLESDAQATNRALEVLRAWTEAGAPELPAHRACDAGSDARVRELQKTILPLLMLAGLVQAQCIWNQPDGRIIGWLGRLLVRLENYALGGWLVGADPRCGHRIVRDVATMAFGGLTADAHRFRVGIRRYFMALAQLNSCHEWPEARGHGPFAAWWCCRQIGCLLLIAELARMHGYDLFNAEFNGCRLHDAIGRFVDTVEEACVIAPMDGYMAEIAGDSLDLHFLHRDLEGAHPLSWIELYAFACPYAPCLRRLWSLGRRSVVRQRPLIDPFVAGNASAFWALAV